MRVAEAEGGTQAHRVQRLDDTGVRTAQLVDAGRLHQLGVDGLARVQRAVGVLENHLHALEEGAVAAMRQLPALDADAALIMLVEAGQRPQHRRLAATGFADKAEGIALGHVEADAVDGADAGIALAEVDGEALNVYHDAAAKLGVVRQLSSRFSTGSRARGTWMRGSEASRPRV